MKKLLISMCMMAGVALAASDFSVTVTNGIKVLPQRGASSTTTWTTGTAYAQGVYIKNGSVTYMAVNAGTSGAAAASAPIHMMGAVQPAAQSIVWLAIESAPRQAIMIQQNLTTGIVSITRGASKGIGTGSVIGASSTYSDASCWQGEVWVNATNQTINVSDW